MLTDERAKEKWITAWVCPSDESVRTDKVDLEGLVVMLGQVKKLIAERAWLTAGTEQEVAKA